MSSRGQGQTFGVPPPTDSAPFSLTGPEGVEPFGPSRSKGF
jgi:hypothetical protein